MKVLRMFVAAMAIVVISLTAVACGGGDEAETAATTDETVVDLPAVDTAEQPVADPANEGEVFVPVAANADGGDSTATDVQPVDASPDAAAVDAAADTDTTAVADTTTADAAAATDAVGGGTDTNDANVGGGVPAVEGEDAAPVTDASETPAAQPAADGGKTPAAQDGGKGGTPEVGAAKPYYNPYYVPYYSDPYYYYYYYPYYSPYYYPGYGYYYYDGYNYYYYPYGYYYNPNIDYLALYPYDVQYNGQTYTCSEPPEPTPTASPYIVQPCDNLYRIGLAYDMSWITIAHANGMYNPNVIYVGQALYIPGH